ncbi:hypothetical protein ABIB94_007066 [Bradyrhizobium sp. JR7.2]|uniref:hypothetical protein n=1 Tax=Bradyrhizobium sp. JR7.2 TaxID=3156375 RepID=UPI003399260C
MAKDALTHDNDNSDTWIELAAATANLVRYLEKDRDQAPNGEADKNPEDDAERQRERERFVQTRLREIERFERPYRSIKRP